jgi:hypothetical protein
MRRCERIAESSPLDVTRPRGPPVLRTLALRAACCVLRTPYCVLYITAYCLLAAYSVLRIDAPGGRTAAGAPVRSAQHAV